MIRLLPSLPFMLLGCHLALASQTPAPDSLVLVEAEAFAGPGGWFRTLDLDG